MNSYLIGKAAINRRQAKATMPGKRGKDQEKALSTNDNNNNNRAHTGTQTCHKQTDWQAGSQTEEQRA